MQILVLDKADPYNLGASYKRAFQQCGHDVSELDPWSALDEMLLWRNRYSRRLFTRSILSAFNRRWLPRIEEFDADLVWIAKGAWALPWFWSELKRRRPDLKLVCYNGDNPIVTFSRGGNRPWVTESIGCFDLFCTYNGNLIQPLKQAGARRVAWIPFGWDPQIHPQRQLRAAPEYDVVFVANGDRYREQWLSDIIRLSKGRWRIGVFGKWGMVRDSTVRQVIAGPNAVGSELSDITAKAHISLSILREQNLGSHNMRTFEIPGCGGLMASQYSPEQHAFFPDGEAALYFATATEAVDAIGAVLDDPERASRMRLAAQAIARKHSYLHRAKAMLAAIDTAHPAEEVKKRHQLLESGNSN